MENDSYKRYYVDDDVWYQIWHDNMISFHYLENDFGVVMHPDEAIATARAILKHFGEGLE